ncbi:rod shape-determining protein MreD [Gloeothece citriformis PCC 7424]|uniref:Rod shape-determining protein MreD n=1 Tax=Gloeothece citriformis (strain PCC 7424) TaxID=65393 RepID=B7KF68_GLOC7|nr:rod shape-determining protein MreD [Gloeothece citriformis]ACK71784.1 rod shape-determining protein MreD [Gloeothece citriformis PCC 7424]
MIKLTKLSPKTRRILNGFVIVGSILICIFFSFTRLPGMELLGIGPNWFIIWVVSWSVKRTVFQAIVAGLTLGLIQDGMTSSYPSHVLVFVLIAFITARIQKQRYIKEDLMSVVLIVFMMSLLAETLIAFQYVISGIRPLDEIWIDYQQIALSSAILSSLWTPVLYYPLNNWWENIKALE